MSETKGVNGVVKLAPSTSPAATKYAMLHVTNWSLEETSETIDVTTCGDTSRSILSTFKGFTGTVDGYWDANDVNFGHDGDTASGSDLVSTAPRIAVGDTIDFELYPAGESGSYYAGKAILTSISRSASFDGAVEYSIAFDGTGDLTFAA